MISSLFSRCCLFDFYVYSFSFNFQNGILSVSADVGYRQTSSLFFTVRIFYFVVDSVSPFSITPISQNGFLNLSFLKSRQIFRFDTISDSNFFGRFYTDYFSFLDDFRSSFNSNFLGVPIMFYELNNVEYYTLTPNFSFDSLLVPFEALFKPLLINSVCEVA